MAAAPAAKKEKSPMQSRLYDVSSGKVVRKNNTCPKCGPSVVMAKHKDRETCGKCFYTVFGKK